MKRDNRPSHVFENDKVTFKSFIKEFTNDDYKSFDLTAKKIGLDSKIDDLFNGKLVNFTEKLAAWHPKYRAQYNPKKSDNLIISPSWFLHSIFGAKSPAFNFFIFNYIYF